MAQEEEGAGPRELLHEACRRNNLELLQEVLITLSKAHITTSGDPEEVTVAHFLNTATDALGNTPVHLAAQYGAYEVLDHLLDQEGLEVDPLDRMEKETPLHKAVKYASEKDKEGGLAVVELLIDAGADPRIRNIHKQLPIDIADPRHTQLRSVLQRAEYAMTVDDDVVVDDDDDMGRAGSASDSE